MLRDSPAVEEFGLDVGLTRIFLKGRPGRLEPVTAASGSREGQPVTSAVLDETHLWRQSNGGTKLAATIRRNVAKMGGVSIESTNAYQPGEGSVAEKSEQAKGKEQAGLLMDIGPQVQLSAADLRNKPKCMKALAHVYGDSTRFVDIERIYEDATDVDTEPEDALRYFFNMIVKGSEQAFDTKRWATLADAKAVVADKELVTLGFDGARYHDATGLILTHVETGHQQQVGLWENDGSPDWEVSPIEVTDTLRHLFDRFDIWRLYADPWYWETQVNSEWPAEFGADKVIAWDTRPPKKMAYAVRAFANAMRAGEMSHDGDSHYANHIANARKRSTNMRDEEGQRLWVIQKEHPTSPNKIDLAMAGILSREARNDCIAAGGNSGGDKTFFTFS
jgi:phage terminase large subunit-like protein